MMRLSAPSLAALAVAGLLASLTLVAWRQARALESLGALEAVRSDVSLAQAESEELSRRIQRLESRAYVVEAAESRLEMRTPEAAEIVYLTGAQQ
jgi:hypothetical protein